MASQYWYDDAANREDLLDLITNTSPRETQLFSGLGKSKAESIRHEWLTDSLKTPAHNAFAEGVDASYPGVSNPARLVNYTQIIREGYQVTDSEEAGLKAGMQSRVSYEDMKQLMNWKNDAEFALMRASLVCGSGSTPRSMQGVKNFINSGTVPLYTNASGVSLTEALLNDRLQDVWNAGAGEVDAIYVPMYLKRKISAFGTNITKNVAADDRRLVQSIDTYQADAAKLVKLFPHRYITVSGDTNYDIVGIQEDKFRVAIYRSPYTRELAKTGDSTNKEAVGEITLEVLTPKAGFWAKGML